MTWSIRLENGCVPAAAMRRPTRSAASARSRRVRMISDAHESVHGTRPAPHRQATTTDARHYLNELALPALCYGPRVRDIHGVDEAVELASIVAGARTLTRFIPAFMT